MNSHFLCCATLLVTMKDYKISGWLLIVVGLSTIGFHTSRAQILLEAGVRVIPQSSKFMNSSSTGDYLFADPIINRRGFRVRPAVGVGAMHYMAQHWTIGLDLLYSPQGGGYQRRRTNTNYLKIPLWLGYSAHRKRRLVFNTQVGIEYCYLLNAVLIDDFADQKSDVRSYVRRDYIGIAYTIGLKKYLYNNTRAVNLQFYMSYGLTNINREGSLVVRHLILPGLRITIDALALQPAEKKP